jgi:hypothetical protein
MTRPLGHPLLLPAMMTKTIDRSKVPMPSFARGIGRMESIGMSTSTARYAQNACTTMEHEDLALCNFHQPPELVNAGTATPFT